VKTALEKFNKNNKIKFIKNKYFKNYCILNSREKIETILLYPFLAVLFSDTKIEYQQACSNNFCILYWNCNGITPNKINGNHNGFNSILKQNPDILILSELKFDTNINIINYTIVKINKPIKNKRGIIILAKNNFIINIIQSLQSYKNDIIVCELSECYLIPIYYPPDCVKTIIIKKAFGKN